MKNTKDLTFLVTAENRPELQDLYQIVRFYKNKGQSIPPNIVMRIFEILYEKETYENAQLWDQAEKYAEIALKKLQITKGYKLSWQPRLLSGNIDSVKPDTKYVFTEIIYAFLLAPETKKNRSKDAAISFFYSAIKDEYKMQLIPQHIKTFTKYKQAVVSGLLAIAIGFKITGKTNPTNEQIFQATKNAIKRVGDYWE